jgi:HTH-type transcriptional regulator / antitoxin HipB
MENKMKNNKLTKNFRDHLNEKLKDKSFSEAFNYERELIVIAVKLARERERLGMTQIQLAKKAKITQQQLSKVERGENCNLKTFLKVTKALNLSLVAEPAANN